MPPEALIATMVGAMLLMLGVIGLLVSRGRVTVPPGGAIIIHRTGGEPRVTFDDAFVPPLVARAETIDCSTRTLAIVREGKDSLRCRDNLRVDVRAEFQIAVNRTTEDVLRVVRSIGAARAADPAALRDLFESKVVDAMATVIRHFEFDSVTREREELRDKVIEVVGKDLGGFILHDVTFSRIEQVPLEALDPDNVLDAEAIRRITERVSEERMRTEEIQTRTQHEITARALARREAELAAERSPLPDCVEPRAVRDALERAPSETK